MFGFSLDLVWFLLKDPFGLFLHKDHFCNLMKVQGPVVASLQNIFKD